MDIKQLRKEIDSLIFEVEQTLTNDMDIKTGRAYSLVRTKLEEAKMWAGKVLEARGKSLPVEFADHCKKREESND